MYFHFRGPGTLLGGPEPMTELFVREIHEGIGDTGVRAAILKCATDTAGSHTRGRTGPARRRPGPSPDRCPHHHPHADATRTVGARATTDLGRRGCGPLQVVIGHSGGTLDIGYHEALIANGSFLGFDHFGIGTIPLADRVESVRLLCERGHAGRIVLSHDAMCHVRLVPPGRGGGVEGMALDPHPRRRPAGHAGCRHQRRGHHEP